MNNITWGDNKATSYSYYETVAGGAGAVRAMIIVWTCYTVDSRDLIGMDDQVCIHTWPIHELLTRKFSRNGKQTKSIDCWCSKSSVFQFSRSSTEILSSKELGWSRKMPWWWWCWSTNSLSSIDDIIHSNRTTCSSTLRITWRRKRSMWKESIKTYWRKMGQSGRKIFHSNATGRK